MVRDTDSNWRQLSMMIEAGMGRLPRTDILTAISRKVLVRLIAINTPHGRRASTAWLFLIRQTHPPFVLRRD